MNRRTMLGRSVFLLSSSYLNAFDSRVTLRPDGQLGRNSNRLLFDLLRIAKPGATLTLDPDSGGYTITRPVILDVPGITLDGSGAEIHQDAPDSPGLIVTAPGVTIQNLTVARRQSPIAMFDDQTARAGIRWIGKPDAYLSDLSLNSVALKGWSYGLLARYCERANVTNNTIEDISYAGIMFESSRNSRVSGNQIRRVLGKPNSYGIAITRGAGPIGEHPISHGFRVFDNKISDVSHWEGLDTHAGIDIEFFRNVLTNVRIGIMITSSEGHAPKRCHAYDNIITAGTAAQQTGAEIVGLPTSRAEDCVIENNLIDGFGTQGSDAGAAVRVQWAIRPRVASNRIQNSLQSALALFGTIDGLDVEDNSITGIDATGGPFIAAIKIPSGSVSGRIVRNHIEAGIAAGIRTFSPQPVLVDQNDIRTTGRPYHPNIGAFRTP
jgi:parallel beta-helix repeat protein